jgi:hypothetical protein
VAHVNLHLATGLLIGSSVTIGPLLRGWISERPVAVLLLRSLVVSFTLAAWAIVPNVLTTLGASSSVHESWWSNLFLGHAALDRRTEGGLLIGELVIAGYLTAVYLVVLLAIRRARRRPSE